MSKRRKFVDMFAYLFYIDQYPKIYNTEFYKIVINIGNAEEIDFYQNRDCYLAVVDSDRCDFNSSANIILAPVECYFQLLTKYNKIYSCTWTQNDRGPRLKFAIFNNDPEYIQLESPTMPKDWLIAFSPKTSSTTNRIFGDYTVFCSPVKPLPSRKRKHSEC